MAHLQEAAVKQITEICDRYANERTPLMMILSDIQKEYGFGQSMVNSIGAGVGFLVAMVMFAGVRERLEGCDIPKALKGLPITLIDISQ